MARAPFLDKFIRPERDTAAYVRRSIEALLNTKEGYGSFLRGFGLGGYTGKSGTRDLLVALLEEMKEEIRLHEPRITHVKLLPRGRDAAMRMLFDLTGVIEGEPRALRIVFDTTTGEVKVEDVQ